MFHSPSQERVRYFSSQEGSTRIFPRKVVFAWPKNRGWIFFSRPEGGIKNCSQARTFLPRHKKRGREKKAHDRPHTAEDERKFPRKSRSEESWIKFHNIFSLLLSCTLFYISHDESVLRTDILKNSYRLTALGSCCCPHFTIDCQTLIWLSKLFLCTAELNASDASGSTALEYMTSRQLHYCLKVFTSHPRYQEELGENEQKEAVER